MVSDLGSPTYRREQGDVLAGRLLEPRRFLQVVAGPRQVGKTTLVRQAMAAIDVPHVFASADEPTLRDRTWLVAQWDRGRLTAREAGASGAILVLDEAQKIPSWSETVKSLWDEDSHHGLPLRVVVLGSAPLLVQRGLRESLAGRFETIHVPHWSLSEMRSAFGFTLDQYVHFGGYPGAATLVGDELRWRRYLLDSLIETTLARDVLLLTRIDKPALLRQLFHLACRYSGQVLSFTKMLGQLQDAGNATTLAHYLELLGGAGMVTGLPKYSENVVRSRASSPKLQVLNTALISAQSGRSFREARTDPEAWGHLTESAVGAHLANAAAAGLCEVSYWREGNREVDFVIRAGRQMAAIEVKSGRSPVSHSGLAAFRAAFHPTHTLLVGGDGIPVEDFLSRPVTAWLA